MDDFRVIGLSGPARAGKSTTSRYLADAYNLQRTAFANLLREVAVLMYPWLDWMLDSEQYDAKKEIVDPKLGITPRKVLQLLGTEVGRNIWADTWVDAVRREIHEASALGLPGIVIDDVRFPNEAQMLEEIHDGQLWAIQRPGAGGQVGVAGHASEAYAEELASTADVLLVNDGSFQHLFNQVEKSLTKH